MLPLSHGEGTAAASGGNAGGAKVISSVRLARVFCY
jgi:hypothetical protein